MWNPYKRYFKKKQWNNRKIAFVSILIATSVAFVIVFTNIIAIASIPSFKLMAGGLPVKLTGFIFGPVIGGLTGVLSDLLSFAMRPSFYHYYYTIAWGLAGIIPGIFGIIMNRRKNEEIDKVKLSKINFYITMLVLMSIFITFYFVMMFGIPQSTLENSKVHSKPLFVTIALLGTASMMVALLIFRFVSLPRFRRIPNTKFKFKFEKFQKMSVSTLNGLLPIIAFSSLLEAVTLPIVTLGDQSALFGKTDFITNYTGHLLFSPFKIWGNMLVIAFAYKIVSPLIYSKANNGFNHL